MQFTIEVLSVIGPNKVSKGKSSWDAIEVAYKRDGKVEGKKLVDFTNKKVFEDVQNFKQGEFYEVESSKDDNGYWQWTGVTKSTGASSQQQAPVESGAKQGAPAQSGQSSAGAGRVTGSNYETAEERKVKQRFIVRQSSLSYAIDLLKHNSGGESVSEEAVMKIADKFVAYVYESRVQDMDNDIPV